MFCPQCKAEYRPGFIRCGDCDIDLVDHLPPGAIDYEQIADDGYVVVSTAQGSIKAGQIRSFLEASGIPVEVHGAGFREASGEEILVPRELESAALELLEKADRGELEIEADKESPNVDLEED